jgi:1-deoxy-D-xylulose-5-phosphate reductoisomerase
VNKALEYIEAYYLFNTKNIEIVINRNSHVHSIVKYYDGVMKFHFGYPDMKNPIAFSLSYPERVYKNSVPDITNCEIKFEKIDYEKYSILKLLPKILGNLSLQTAFNASDEIAVEYFLNKKIEFSKIYKIIEKTVEKIDYEKLNLSTIRDVLETDKLSRKIAREIISC